MPRYYYVELVANAEALVAALPPTAVVAYNAALGALILDPWKGHPVFTTEVSDPVRCLPLNTSAGGGFLFYFIAEDAKVVRIYDVLWTDQD